MEAKIYKSTVFLVHKMGLGKEWYISA